MKRRQVIFVLLLSLGFVAQSANGQGAQKVASFRGEWRWAIYARSRDELPPAYQTEKLKDVPQAEIDLTLKQKGNKLTGEYSASRRFLARLEDGEFDANIKGNSARIELTSGFGGTVTVSLRLLGNRLHWKTIKSEGESYFPDDVYLTRVVRRKKRR